MISKNKKRLQVTLSGLTMKSLEVFAKKNNISKSIVIELALNDYFRKDNHDDAK